MDLTTHQQEGGRIHSDNALELFQMRREFERICITLITSSAYNPQTNGQAERINSILLDKLWSMIENSELRPIFWAEAIWHAADLLKGCMAVQQGSRIRMTALPRTTLDNFKL